MQFLLSVCPSLSLLHIQNASKNSFLPLHLLFLYQLMRAMCVATDALFYSNFQQYHPKKISMEPENKYILTFEVPFLQGLFGGKIIEKY